jgi:hypothetical protein
MQPRIDQTRFGSITIAGVNYGHDVLIRLDGQVDKRKKKLSKALYGTSHVLSLAEAQYIFETGAEKVIYGTGQYGRAGLSPEAETFFAQNNCPVELLPTPQAVEAWNQTDGAVIGLFHITC